MKKLKIFLTFILCFTVLFVTKSFCTPVLADNVPASTQEVVVDDTQVPETIPEKNYENLMKIKDSIVSSKTISIIMALFCLAVIMGLGYYGYKLYRKRSSKGYVVSVPLNETLEVPKDFKTAISLFLGKTDE